MSQAPPFLPPIAPEWASGEILIPVYFVCGVALIALIFVWASRR